MLCSGYIWTFSACRPVSPSSPNGTCLLPLAVFLQFQQLIRFSHLTSLTRLYPFTGRCPRCIPATDRAPVIGGIICAAAETGEI